MMNYVYTLRSDGVTIDSNPMLPGIVYDGDLTGYDLKVLPSRTNVSANWDGFGHDRDQTSVENAGKGKILILFKQVRITCSMIIIFTEKNILLSHLISIDTLIHFVIVLSLKAVV
jgi:hypothetical protein